MLNRESDLTGCHRSIKLSSTLWRCLYFSTKLYKWLCNSNVTAGAFSWIQLNRTFSYWKKRSLWKYENIIAGAPFISFRSQTAPWWTEPQPEFIFEKAKLISVLTKLFPPLHSVYICTCRDLFSNHWLYLIIKGSLVSVKLKSEVFPLSITSCCRFLLPWNHSGFTTSDSQTLNPVCLHVPSVFMSWPLTLRPAGTKRIREKLNCSPAVYLFMDGLTIKFYGVLD